MASLVVFVRQVIEMAGRTIIGRHHLVIVLGRKRSCAGRLSVAAGRRVTRLASIDEIYKVLSCFRIQLDRMAAEALVISVFGKYVMPVGQRI